MSLKNILGLGLCSLVLFTSQMAHSDNTCGKVSLADMNWASAEFAAYLDKIILETGFDCKVSLVPSDTVPAITSMTEKAEPDLASELWFNANRDKIEAAIKANKLKAVSNILEDGGEEGWWIPQYFADAHPDIKTVEDALKHPELFPNPENKKRGAFMGCPSGWGCQINTDNLFKAFKGKEAGFDLIDPGSAAGLDGSIAKAYERKQPWIGYYWAPTAILGKFPMYKLDFNVPYDDKMWQSCISKEDCVDPKPSAWAKSEVRTAVTVPFAERAPKAVMDYLSKRTYKNDMLNQILAWMDNEKADGEAGAMHFLKTQEPLWTTWVSPEVAEKIKAKIK
ncbi:ABC transporter substrate-binding protein [Thiofilum flexile]|uniref:ABC transporter substrate-binding protein n=1 Tax=Thiofilum flexile TaxID=125627 RepID=UPI0003828573|nr:ABC transporter substrate-binding protein [Thiofilum flexile]